MYQYKDYHEPNAIDIGDLVKLLDGRIPRIVTDEHVIICFNGHLTFTRRERISDDNNRMMRQVTELDSLLNSKKLDEHVNLMLKDPGSFLKSFEAFMS